MKALLLHPDRTFDISPPLPWNAPDLTKDLELETLLLGMAGSDPFLLDVARRVLLSGLQNDLRTILHRQQALKDSLNEPAQVRTLYDLAVETLERTRRQGWGMTSHYPSSMLYSAVELLEQLLGSLRRVREFASSRRDKFASPAFRTLFDMLRTELADNYLATIEEHLAALKFRRGVLLSAQLGEYNESTNYVLREVHDKPPNWFMRLFGSRSSPDTFYLDERDEAGAQILSEMRYRGISRVAVALAQSADHVMSFFKTLRTEMAFYVGCINLHERLTAQGEPVCFPTPRSPVAPHHHFEGLYDVCLSLQVGRRVVGNAADLTGKSLVLITGANQGGKSTFLRSLGTAQLMMQSGMFVGAETFEAPFCPALFTHYKREEEASMKFGKLDEELARMSAIVDHLVPHSVVLLNESFAATNEREGSEIAGQIVTALLDRRVRVIFVTHLYKFARGCVERGSKSALFLRAERQKDGTRTFRLFEGEPLDTSYGEDLYREIFSSGEIPKLA